MSKKKGDTNYFHSGEDYVLKDVVGYFWAMKGIKCPVSWSEGGGLNEKARKYGIEPTRTTPNGGRSYYDGKTMYKFAQMLEEELNKKAKSVANRTPQKSTREVLKETSEPILSQTTGEQITFDDLKKSQLEELRAKCHEAVDMFVKALADFI